MMPKDTIITAGGMLLQQFSSFFVGMYIARSIGASDYGSISVSRSIIAIVLTLSPLGLDLALMKYLPSFGDNRSLAEAHFRTLRLVVWISNFAIAAAIILAAPSLQAHVYQFPGFSYILIIAAASLPFLADLNLMNAYYRSYGRPGIYSLVVAYFQTIFRSVLNLTAIFIGFGALGVMYGTTFAAVAAVLVVSWHRRTWLRKLAIGVQSKRMAELSSVRHVLSESKWMAANLFVYGITRSIDVVILGLFVESHAVGSYAAFSLIATVVAVYPSALSQTIGPMVARLYGEGKPTEIIELLRRYIYLSAIVASFVFGGVAAFGSHLDIILGESFKISPLLALLLPTGQLLSATLAPTGYALSMTGKHKQELSILIFGSALMVALLFLLTPWWGGIGAALAVVIGLVISNVARYLFVIRHLGGVPGRARDFVPPFFSLLLGYSAEYATEQLITNDLISIFSGCVLYSFVYFLTAYFLFLERRDRSMLINTLRAKFR